MVPLFISYTFYYHRKTIRVFYKLLWYYVYFLLFVSYILLSLLIFDHSFRYFERVKDFFAAVIIQHGVVKGIFIILAGICFFSLSFYLLCSVTIDFIRDHFPTLNCPDETTCLSGIVNSEPHLNEDSSDSPQDSENEVGPEETNELKVGGYKEDRVSVNAVNNHFLL